jgi:hypothetical protein
VIFRGVRRVARLPEVTGVLAVLGVLGVPGLRRVLAVRPAGVPRRAGGRGARRRTAPS